jgi:hypothetical protein
MGKYELNSKDLDIILQSLFYFQYNPSITEEEWEKVELTIAKITSFL